MSDRASAPSSITIRAEISVADPDTCKFTVSETVHPGGPFLFLNRQSGAGSPLIERLFALPGVAHVLVADNVVTVGKNASADWSGLKAEIGAVIRTQRLTGVRAILEAPQASPSTDRNDEQIRAAGGFVEIPPEEEGGEPMTSVASPVTFRGDPLRRTGPVPKLGEHTREVLREVGLSEEEIRELASD